MRDIHIVGISAFIKNLFSSDYGNIAHRWRCYEPNREKNFAPDIKEIV
jgi:hypothetical protein